MSTVLTPALWCLLAEHVQTAACPQLLRIFACSCGSSWPSSSSQCWWSLEGAL